MPRVVDAQVLQPGPLADDLSHGSLRLRFALPLILPGITNGLPSKRGIAASTPAASGDSEIVRGPVFVSGMRSSLASRSTSLQCRLRISPLRQPISSSRRVAATAWTETPFQISARVQPPAWT